MSPRRKERIASNEARFRSVNERIERGLHRFRRADAEVAGFVCECGTADCVALVRVPLEVYARVRSDPRCFVIRPGHELAGAEDVVQRGARFTVVAKHADVAALVEDQRPGAPARIAP